MTTEVLMPQMGESVAEGTLVRWFKSLGEFVERDEPIFEISTDKVDTEVPAPTSGYLSSVLVKEGDTVPVDTIVCVLSQTKLSEAELSAARLSSGDKTSDDATTASDSRVETSIAAGESTRGALTQSKTVRLRAKSSPLVRRLAAEHRVDLSEIRGTGREGRVTKNDLLTFVSERSASSAPTDGDRLETLSPMRRQIAEHMVLSRHTSAHVTSVFEVEMTQVHAGKEQHSAHFKEEGTKLTYLAFILREAAKALKEFPIFNASLEDDQVRYHGTVNIGVAVALEHGLIVPVVQETDKKSLLEVSRSVQDLATRARSKKLNPEEVRGGTFTVTNPGVFGPLIGTPIIHQPQVAILCVGKVEKRPIVLPGTDTIVARRMLYLSLSYDHRLIDGATADQFLASIKANLESEDVSNIDSP